MRSIGGVFLASPSNSRSVRLAAKTKINIQATPRLKLHGNLYVRSYNFCVSSAHYRTSRVTFSEFINSVSNTIVDPCCSLQRIPFVAMSQWPVIIFRHFRYLLLPLELID